MPRRILMSVDAVGGVWTYALDLARGLAERHGTAVTLAVLGPAPSAAHVAEADAVPGLGVRSLPCRLEWMDDPWRDVARSGDWLLDLERETGAEIVHLNGYAHGALPFRAPKLVAGHSCVLSWWQAVRGEPAPSGEWARYRAAVETGLRGADRVVAPTRAMLRSLRQYYDFATRGWVIYNGRPERPLGIRKRHQVFCAGRLWDDAKNAALLAGIAGTLPWPVRLAGDAGDAELPGATVLGRLDAAAMAEEYRQAIIYCLPARYEPFGLSILEAAMARCALVVGDIASLREVWGEAAVYVAPDSPEALRSALAALIADPERQALLGRAAQRRARRYTAAAMSDGYAALYDEMLTPLPAAAQPD